MNMEKRERKFLDLLHVAVEKFVKNHRFKLKSDSNEYGMRQMPMHSKIYIPRITDAR